MDQVNSVLRLSILACSVFLWTKLKAWKSGHKRQMKQKDSGFTSESALMIFQSSRARTGGVTALLEKEEPQRKNVKFSGSHFADFFFCRRVQTITATAVEFPKGRIPTEARRVKSKAQFKHNGANSTNSTFLFVNSVCLSWRKVQNHCSYTNLVCCARPSVFT